MSIASRIETIEEHISNIYDTLELGGADLANIDKNIINIDTEWKNRLKDYLANGIEVIWDNWEKVVGEGTQLSLTPTTKGKMRIELKGNTYQKNAILPSGYTQVDYIQSSGTQYIDTGVIPTIYDSIETKFSTLTTPNDRNLYGSRGANNSGDFTIWINTSSDKGIAVHYPKSETQNKDTSWFYTDDIITNPIILKVTPDYCYVNNEIQYTFAETRTSYDGTYTAYLFAKSQSGAQNLSGSFKVYYFKIWQNNTLVRDFIPCYRNSDNEVGLYDLVNNVFYTNQGTGAFTYGSVANIPNPDFPMSIQVVSGDNTIKVEGKNLLNISGINSTRQGVLFKEENGYLSITGTSTSGYTSYDIEVNTIPSGTTIYLYSPDSTGNIVFYARKSDSTNIGSITNGGSLLLTSDMKYLRVNVNDTNLHNDRFRIMLSTSPITSYQPYQSQSYPISLGNIELCKIGDYQDYIYKDSGKWYKYGAIGKVVLDGSEAGWSYPSANRFNLDNEIQYIKARDTKNYLSNCYVAYNQKDTNADFNTLVSSVNSGFNLSSGAGIYYTIRIKDTNYSSLETFKTWLTTHNTTVYYVLATPTYEEITGELLSQLNALNSANSYINQTNISQTNNILSFEIDAIALKNI